MEASFKKLIDRFQDNIIVVSYRSDGIPSKREMVDLFKAYGKDVKVYERPYRYVLSPTIRSELLFIAG
jgi:adenine-specific DNA methylase